MAFQLQDDQQVDLTIEYKDAAGNTATVDGPTTWSSSDESILTVTSGDEIGSTATAAAVGPLGTAQIQSSGDADLGEGVTQILGVLDVEVVASEAVSATITPGEPT